MLNIRKVLVPSDNSEIARRAFEHARFTAKRFDAELHVLHIVEESGPSDYLLDSNLSFRGRSVAELVDYAGETSGDEIGLEFDEPAATDLPDGDATDRIRYVRRTAKSPAEGILGYAREIDADLIVMGTRGRKGARRLFMGSLAEDVVYAADCPVLTVRSGSLTVPGRGVSRVLVPVDLSAVSESQIHHAQELAETYGAELDILHVIEVPHASAFFTVDEFNATVPAIASKAREARVELASRGRSTVPTRYHVLVGHPAIDILDFAEAQVCDLIVVATHARKGDRHMLLGSVAEQVIRRAPLLVATMKASGKSLVSAPGAAEPIAVEPNVAVAVAAALDSATPVSAQPVTKEPRADARATVPA